MDRREPQIRKVWTFGEDDVTREVHPTARVDVGAGFVREFVTDYLTKIWCRVPMFGRKNIYGSVKWLGVLDFLRVDVPAWTSNLLDPFPSWDTEGPAPIRTGIVNTGGVPTLFLSRGIVPSMSFQFTTIGSLKTRAALRAVSVTISFKRIVCWACKVPSLSATPSTVGGLISGMTTGMISGMSQLINNLCGEFLLVVSVSVNFFLSVTSGGSYLWIAICITLCVIFL